MRKNLSLNQQAKLARRKMARLSALQGKDKLAIVSVEQWHHRTPSVPTGKMRPAGKDGFTYRDYMKGLKGYA